MRLTLPEGLKLGVALSALQVEGECAQSTWTKWAEKGKISNGSTPAHAGGHWERTEEDARLMRALHIQCCRMSVSFARIEPEKGEFSLPALNHYKNELALLNAYGIEPIVTLHHFDEPLWFAKEGGFSSAEGRADFLTFVSVVVEALGALCGLYITINEPNVYAYNGFLYGLWPPGRYSPAAARDTLRGMAECHIASYALIHRLRPKALVSAAFNVRAFDPLFPRSAWQRRAADAFARWFQESPMDAFFLRKSAFPIPPLRAEPGKYYDFIALNYYTRSLIGDFRLIPKNRPVSDLKWEVYPDGLTRVCRAYYARYQAPLMIAENGVCDLSDAFRSRYLYDHLSALCASLTPVTHYCHWSLLDNFEWLDGEKARFGLVHVDFDTQARSLKDSARFFSDIIVSNGVTDAAYLRYVAPQQYPVSKR